jgi:MFS family permease
VFLALLPEAPARGAHTPAVPAEVREYFPSRAGAVLAAVALTSVLASVVGVFGALYSDCHTSRHGRRRPFLLVCSLEAAACLCIVLLSCVVRSFWLLLLGFIPAAWGLSILFAVSAAFVADVSPEDKRGFGMSLLAAAAVLGNMCGGFAAASYSLHRTHSVPAIRLRHVRL